MQQRWVRHAVKEMRHVRSFDDLRNVNRKLAFLVVRARGGFVKGTTAPPNLQIEPTNSCNLKCICCSAHSNVRKRGFMDFDFFRRIIDEAADIGVGRIHLYLHGEPLLHPRIGDMIRHVKSRQLALTMATNSMLLDAKKIADLLSSGMTNADHLLLSVLGFSKETHEKIMRGVNHERVETNIANFMEYRRSHKLNGPVVETVFYQMDENRGEEEDYRSYWQRKVDNARVARESGQYAEFRDGIPNVPARTRTCHHLWERMSIHWNGDVALCVADIDGNYKLGSLRESSICDLWNGEGITRIRECHKNGDFKAVPLCAACDW